MAPKKRAASAATPVRKAKRATPPAASQNVLEHALGDLSLRDFESGGIRVTHAVPGRPGPHVAAIDVIKTTTQTSRDNAVHQWTKIKREHSESANGVHTFHWGHSESMNVIRTFRFPGQRGSATEVVDIPTALQIIMLLPGRAAAALRLKASVLLVRFLGGDVSLIGAIHDMNAIQEHLREHWPEHPLVRFRESLDAAPPATDGAVQPADVEKLAPEVLPRLVQHLVPVCVSKFKEAFENVWAAQARSQRETLEKMQALLAQQSRAIVNVNCSARRVEDLERVNISPPTTAADVASVKHGTLHVSRYLRQRWRPEWQRAGLTPPNVLGAFSHLMTVRKLQELERRGFGETPAYAGQINRPTLSSPTNGVVHRSAIRGTGARCAAGVPDMLASSPPWGGVDANRPAILCKPFPLEVISAGGAVALWFRRGNSGAQLHYKSDDLAIMASVFDNELWFLIREKLRCKGVDVSGMVRPQAVGGGADPQQSRLSDFFPKQQ